MKITSKFFSPDPEHAKIAIYRSLIAIAVMMVFSMIKLKVYPMGLSYGRMIIPLLVTYVLVGASIGVAQPADLEHSAIHGALLGLLVYGILSIWLMGVGFLKVGGMFMHLIIGIATVVVAAVVTFEVSKAVHINDADAPSSHNG